MKCVKVQSFSRITVSMVLSFQGYNSVKGWTVLRIEHSQGDSDAPPLLPRFLLQEIIFAHGVYVLYFSQPRLRGNLLCRADWLCLRWIASCECAILPIREIAIYSSRCSVCEQTSSGERQTARGSLPAPEHVNKFWWQSTDSQQDNSTRGRNTDNQNQQHFYRHQKIFNFFCH